MATINIRRDVTDQFYRYKMPKLQAKIEGRGNGIKTLIPNMSAIASALAREPAYITKFFGFELGTLVKMDEKKDRYIVNGAHDAEKLASILDVFIDKFLLCGECKNPETEFIFEKNGDIKMDCQACGAKSLVDMRNRLSSYIQKHRPAKKDDKYTKAKEKADKAATANSSDNEKEAVTAEEIAALPRAEDREETEWAEDTGEEAVAARMKELAVSGAVSKLMDEDNENDPLQEFADFISKNLNNLSPDEIYKKSLDFGLKEDKSIAVVAQLVLNEKLLSENQIEKQKELFQLFLKNEKCQKALVGGIERLVGVSHRSLLPRVALVFKDLYFNDLVEEPVFLAWAEKISKRYVDKKVGKELRDKATPFIDWLQNAQEESD